MGVLLSFSDASSILNKTHVKTIYDTFIRNVFKNYKNLFKWHVQYISQRKLRMKMLNTESEDSFVISFFGIINSKKQETPKGCDGWVQYFECKNEHVNKCAWQDFRPLDKQCHCIKQQEIFILWNWDLHLSIVPQ